MCRRDRGYGGYGLSGITFLNPRFLAFLLLAAVSACAAVPAQCVPARWNKPAILDLLKDSPINCLVVDSSAAQAEARRRGLAIVRLVRGTLASPSLDLVPLFSRDRVPPSANLPVVALADSLWPRLRPMSDTGASAGPTGDPWIDSNLWRVRSLRASHKERQIWLTHAAAASSPQDYLRAVADAAMAGGRWVVALDDDLQRRLLEKQPEALATWRRINEYLKFFEEHAAWRLWQPRARLGIVQDWDPSRVALSGENQNPLSRRHMPYRVIDRSDLSTKTLGGLDAVVAVDLSPPTAAERRLLENFAEAGGLVVVAPSWKMVGATAKPYTIEPRGKGRVAIYSKTVADPFGLSLDVLNLMGKASLGLRLFNVSSIVSSFTEDETGRRALLQVVNYADWPLERVTARVSGDFRSARLYAPEGAPVEIPLERRGADVELTIPRVSIYAAVLLE